MTTKEKTGQGGYIGIIVAVIVVIIIAIVVISWPNSTAAPTHETASTTVEVSTSTPVSSPVKTSGTSTVGSAAFKTVIIDYTDAGFTTTSMTINSGDTVRWVNNSSHGMWIGSATHPTHTAYSGTTVAQHCPDTSASAFDQCESTKKGTSFSFTFNKEGTWGYHNHVRASDYGKIIVK